MAENATRPEHDSLPTKWVVGVDGSESARHAALWAAANADGRASEIQLASAWSVPVSTAMAPMTPMTTTTMIDAVEHAASHTVNDLADHIGPSSTVPVTTPITTSVGQGGAARLLLDAAHHSSLLVVGSRGRGGFARLVLGSTSTQCATHSTSPVAVIPASAAVARPVSIVVAFDGSPNSIEALKWAIDFADPGSTIECVSVWDAAPVSVGSDQFFFPEASDLARERFEHLSAETLRLHPSVGVDVKNVFVEGRPRQVLAEYAGRSDLLVVGARGYSAFEAAVLGSVSTWLLHHVSKAMIVVPHPSPHDEPTDDEVDDLRDDEED